MYCGKCGSKIEEGNSFCPYCGEPVQNQGEPVTNTPVAAKKKSNKTGIIVGVSVVAAVVLVVMGIVFAVVIGSIGNKLLSAGSVSDYSSQSSYSEELESSQPSYSDEQESSQLEGTESLPSSSSSSDGDFEDYMYYLYWTKADWQAASYEDKEMAVFTCMTYILALNDIPASEAIAYEMLEQQADWVDGVDSYYGLGLEDTTVFDIMNDPGLLQNLLIGAGVM